MWFRSLALLALVAWAAQNPAPFRPPAVPLVTHDPYFSIWSMNDRLTDAPTKHWTGTEHGLTGIARLDGKPYRFLGTVPRSTMDAMAAGEARVRLEHLRRSGVSFFERNTGSCSDDRLVLDYGRQTQRLYGSLGGKAASISKCWWKKV